MPHRGRTRAPTKPASLLPSLPNTPFRSNLSSAFLGRFRVTCPLTRVQCGGIASPIPSGASILYVHAHVHRTKQRPRSPFLCVIEGVVGNIQGVVQRPFRPSGPIICQRVSFEGDQLVIPFFSFTREPLLRKGWSGNLYILKLLELRYGLIRQLNLVESKLHLWMSFSSGIGTILLYMYTNR
ncbi:hypothetical protein BJV74DRAFT_810974 [Russula compacta]|nr:hypothetical protein BJV74DRAFT_810974 [Russula compacta]